MLQYHKNEQKESLQRNISENQEMNLHANQWKKIPLLKNSHEAEENCKSMLP